ncbi:MAG: hypothetical protein CL683_04510 [Brevundimonas sp.]|jgi:hypothetical protein|uniref:hypothetical protein n=1 Tax=Brevundimonas sp. TaxID=1871086 RepID=UPI000C46EFB7|nr:hypothetical protein [Brevundimonas sp.]MAL88143.1 hypothetical protein [Brevundimonas sp.]|tara:strand:+ start:2723 stop:2953 length:231 start_codon:yes stop_codon:yes gene_type:complete
MSIKEALKILLNEAESSALGDGNRRVFEALKVYRKREAVEQLMHDIDTILEGFDIEEKERLKDILCDAVLSNFPSS